MIWEAGPPTLAFHLLHDDLRLTTHWRALPFPGGAGDAARLRHRHAARHRRAARRGGRRLRAGSERPLQHGEQLAPLIDRALRETGLAREDLTAIGVGVGPGPFTGLRVGLVTARTLGYVLEIPVYGACTLDVLAIEAVDTGAVGNQGDGEFVVATDARRKEVYLATYDGDGERLEGPMVAKPAVVATEAPVVGEGAVLYPDAFPHAAGPTMPSAGWLARVIAEERVGLHDPEPLYLRRPDAAMPGLPSGSRDRPDRHPDGRRRDRGLRGRNLGADAWSHALVEEGVAGRLPTVHYLVAEEEHRLVGHAVASLPATSPSSSGSRWLRTTGAPGVASALLEAVLALSAAAARPGAPRGPGGQRGRARLLRRSRLRRGGPAPALLP